MNKNETQHSNQFSGSVRNNNPTKFPLKILKFLIKSIKDPKKFKNPAQKLQTIGKISQDPPKRSISPKVQYTENQRNKVLEEYRKREQEETLKYGVSAEKPKIYAENQQKLQAKMSPITNLLGKERNFVNPNEKTSTIKKIENDQKKHINNFLKDKTIFTKMATSPNQKKEWDYLKQPGVVIRKDDENVFYKYGLEKIQEQITEIRFSKIFLYCFILVMFVYIAVFFYHLYKAETYIFCDTNELFQKDCKQCPNNGLCENGFLV